MAEFMHCLSRRPPQKNRLILWLSICLAVEARSRKHSHAPSAGGFAENEVESGHKEVNVRDAKPDAFIAASMCC
jgi:hypothetical protein